MRYCKLLLMGGILLAFSMPAMAITITMHMVDFDEGTLYNVGDGTYTTGPTLDGLTQITPTGGFINGHQSDTWGVFRVDDIKDNVGNYIYQGQDGLGGHEITAIFWGLTDTYLNQATGGGEVVQEIHGVGLQAAFFYDYNPIGTPDWATAVTAGPGAWDNTTGPVDGALNLGPVYPGITDGTLLWTMRSTSGWNKLFPTEEFFNTYKSEGANYGSNGNMLLDMATVDGWGTGPSNFQLDTNTINGWNTTGTAKTKMADILLAFSGSDDDTQGWLLRTSDPLEGNLVPEPITMTGLLLGIGCLGRYIRNRR